MIVRLLLVVSFLVNAAMAQASHITNKTLIVGSEEDFPPFAIGHTDETAGGYTVDLWREVAKEAGVNYTIRVRPWGQILQEFKDGKIDVLINIAQSEDRHQYTDFSVPHVTVHGAIFVRKDESRIRSEADLAGKSIIVFKSDLAHEYAVSKGWQKQLVIVNNAQEGLKLLASGRHDAMLLSKLSGMQTLKELKIKSVKVLDANAGYSQKFSFGVHRGDSDLLARLNEGLVLTKTSGAYDAIYNTWFGVYEAKKPTLRDMVPYIAPILIISLIIGSYNFRKRRIERIREREALASSEENLRLILDSAGEGIYGIDLKGNCTFCNPACLKILGYSRPDDLLGKNMHHLIHHSRPDGTAYPVEECRIYKAFKMGNGSHVDDEVLWRSDGTCFQAEYRSYPQFREGNAIGSVVTFTDISVRRLSEESMRESHGRTLAILNGLDAIVYVADMTTYEVLFVNDLLKNTFGDIVGQTCWKTIQTGLTGPCPFCSNDRLIDDAGNPAGIYRWEFQNTSNGRWYDVRDRAIQWIDGRLVRLEIASDITEHKKAEEEKLLLEQQFQHAQKLESLGVLAGGIAHDFNNILAIIIGYCSLAMIDSDRAESSIPEIEKAAHRAAELCRQMMSYAGKAELSMTRVDMCLLVDEMIKMLKTTIPHNAAISSTLSADTSFVYGDAGQIRQIVMNLIINASEAIGKEQGEICISLAPASIPEGQIEKDYHGKAIPPGRYACLEVTDSGCGMDEETKWRIFEPFYTTKFTGRGLGMSAVLGIIMSHKGALQLFSQLERGTTFKIYLPAQIMDPNGNKIDQKVSHTPWKGSGTVLLVEDEKQIRTLAKSMLSMLGFTVIEASNGREALELFQKSAADITVVLTDMGMPIMDGYALFRELKQRAPDLPIIISSGFGDAAISSEIDPADIAGLISKPYNFDRLRNVMKMTSENAQRYM